MNKQEEKRLFKLFQEKYNEMPSGEVAFEDKPDIILTTTTGQTIGIELTEAIYDQNLMKESEFQIKFNNMVLDSLQDALAFTFTIDINLDSSFPLRQKTLKSTLREVVEFCVDEFKNLPPNEIKYVEQLDVDWSEGSSELQEHFRSLGYRKLPKGISRIRMSRFDGLTKSYHLETKGGEVPNFTNVHLDAILKKKDNALRMYKVCQQQWLVIAEGHDFYSHFNYVKVESKFETRFNKVFLYRIWDEKVVILK